MKRFLLILLAIVCALTLMLAEYRFIMLNLCPYIGENNVIYIEIFDRVDEYQVTTLNIFE